MGISALKYALGILTILMSGVLQADYLFDYEGKVDRLSKDIIVLDDISFPISLLANCYDSNGNTYIACKGLKVGDHVGVFIELQGKDSQQVVVEIRKIKNK